MVILNANPSAKRYIYQMIHRLKNGKVKRDVPKKKKKKKRNLHMCGWGLGFNGWDKKSYFLMNPKSNANSIILSNLTSDLPKKSSDLIF